jgi:hypothetical protein
MAAASMTPVSETNVPLLRASTASDGSANLPVARASTLLATASWVAAAARSSAAFARSASFSASVFWASSNALSLSAC